MKILFVEDDAKFRDEKTKLLESAHYQVEAVGDPGIVLELFEKGKYDLVLVDYMLGSMNGIQLIKYVKKIDKTVKTIILTGIDSPDVEIYALETTSVDQFLNKGVRDDVLLKYVERVLAKASLVNEAEEQHFLYSERENIKIDLENYEVYQDEAPVSVTFKEYQLLVYFMENTGKVLKREEIVEALWGEQKDEITSLRVVDSHLKLLRKKLGLRVIHSVRGVGYRWNE